MDIPYTEHRPWGSFTQFTSGTGETVTVKLIFVKQGGQLSLQKHALREEFWRILEGSPRVTIDDSSVEAKPGDEFTVSRASLHRLEAPRDNVIVLEIARGEFKEDDIERLEDRYGRS